MKRIAAVLMCLATVPGCAALKNLQSKNVGPQIAAPDVGPVTEDMAQFLAFQLPAAKTTLAIEPAETPLHQSLIGQLTGKGFGVSDDDPQAVSLRYLVTPLDGGVLVRMQYKHTEASRYYPRASDGSLSFSNIYSVREADK